MADATLSVKMALDLSGLILAFEDAAASLRESSPDSATAADRAKIERETEDPF
jgi:hypothetical protein